jgi:CP family cyanate transporter-like MFS transporter
MRITVLAIPPLLSLIHSQLHLDEKGVGILTGLPTLLFSAAAVGGALLISRIGARRAVITGLGLVAVAGAVRGVGPSVLTLFGATLVMGIGIALVQPAFPVLVRIWSAHRIALATATYSTGLLVGEALPPALTAAVILPLTGGWPQALAAWSVPVLAGALLIAWLTPAESAHLESASRRWWPDWRSSRTWRLGLMLGGDSALYWSCNAFLPDFLQHTGRPGLIAPALTALNAGQIPAAFVIAALPGALLNRRAYWVPGLLLGSAVIALVTTPGPGPAFVAGAIGFLSAWIFVLALALPPLLADPGEVHRLSAAMFTLTYVCSFTAPVLGGAIWDLSRFPPFAFIPGFCACGLVAAMAAGLRLPARPGLQPVPAG